MKIDIIRDSDRINIVNAYSNGAIIVGNTTFRSSLVLGATEIIDDWPPQSFPDLTPAHLEQVLSLEPEIILFGTGSSIQFPDEDLLMPVTSRQIGYEIMDTGAACRSYNFLVSEGRNAVAALFMIG